MMSEKQQSLLAMASSFPFSFYNPVLQLKAVAEGNSRLFSIPHPTQRTPASVLSGSPLVSRASPPTASPAATHCSPPVSSPHVARLHQLHHQHHKNLKFSIDNILSPTFGAAPRASAPDDLSASSRGKREKVACKRKYSSDSDSSTSSQSTRSLSRATSPKKEETAKSSSSSAASSTSSSTSSSSKGSSERDAARGPNTSPLLPFPLDGKEPMVWPAWVYCTRYSDRPSSGKTASLSLPLSS